MKYNNPPDPTDKNTIYGKIHALIKPDSVVLEFGPAGGWTTRFLKEQLNCRVYIVEIDKDGYEMAVKFAEKGFLGNIESFEWLDAFQGIQFDYIIFADVLEHLYSPNIVLEKCAGILKDEGSVIMSIPNVANNNIILNLLNNNFAYTEVGLLDYTHVRFFAYNQIIDMVREAGFYPIMMDSFNYEVGRADRELVTSYRGMPVEAAQYIANREYADIYQFVIQMKKILRGNEIPVRLAVNKDYRFVFPFDVKIYIDKGDGYTNLLCKPMHGIKDQSLTFNLSGIQGIKRLRFDPFGELACEIIIQNIKTNMNGIMIRPLNADVTEGSKSKFYHKEPMYEIIGDFSDPKSITIKYHIEPLDWNDGHELFANRISYDDKKMAEYEEELKAAHEINKHINNEYNQRMMELEAIKKELNNARDIIDRIRNFWLYKAAKRLHLIPKQFIN